MMILRNLYYMDNSFRQYGKKKDVLSCRLICKRLANIGQDIAFENIEFLQDEEGVQRLLSQVPL